MVGGWNYPILLQVVGIKGEARFDLSLVTFVICDSQGVFSSVEPFHRAVGRANRIVDPLVAGDSYEPGSATKGQPMVARITKHPVSCSAEHCVHCTDHRSVVVSTFHVVIVAKRFATRSFYVTHNFSPSFVRNHSRQRHHATDYIFVLEARA